MRLLDSLCNKLIDTISPTRLVVGLSGGADSTLILLTAKRVTELCPDFSVQAVHCIHGLDEDDPVWFDHCTSLCQRLSVPLATPKLNIVYGQGRSPEEVSRAERYRALLENLGPSDVLLLGHQADDQVESFLLSLKRGSGPYGLSGMRYMVSDSRGTIIRPLLELNKATIIEIIEALGFNHVFDISNTYLKFERNFIRLKVLPLLRERFPGIDRSVLRSQKLCAYENDLATRYTRAIFERHFDKDRMALDFTDLDLSDDALMVSLIRMLVLERDEMPPELNAVENAAALMRCPPDQAGIIKLETGTLRRFRNGLYLVDDKLVPKKDVYELKAGQSMRLGDYTYTLTLNDESNIKSVVLDFTYSHSLRIKPLKRAHSREIKKLFAEYEVPVWLRATKPLVKASDGTLLLFADLAQITDAGIRLEIS